MSLLGVCWGCSNLAKRSLEVEIFKLNKAPRLTDDLQLAPLIEAASAQIELLSKQQSKNDFVFGRYRYSREEYLAGLKYFVELAKLNQNKDDFLREVAHSFDFLTARSNKDEKPLLVTGYYEPIIYGSLVRTSKFTQALYRTPNDLLKIELSEFDPKFVGERELRGRVEQGKVFPYYSREEIDSLQMLSGKGLELCWVDPIDAFFLHIQGSGTIVLAGGQEIRLNYSERNGHPYVAIGKFLRDILPLEDINLHTIEKHLRTLPIEEQRRLLNLNPSYVFFRQAETRALTSIGLPATPGRTIATDPAIFPRGALGYLLFDPPIPVNSEEQVPTTPQSQLQVGRLVLNQDTGGAIKGPNRVDLFWGRGDEAKYYAGHLKSRGQLMIIVPKRNDKIR